MAIVPKHFLTPEEYLQRVLSGATPRLKPAQINAHR